MSNKEDLRDDYRVPEGYRIMTDDEIVTHGDKVLDYKDAQGIADITEEGHYDCLLGLCGEQARLHTMCFEVYTKRPVAAIH